MYIDMTCDNRGSLTQNQKEFLERVIPWAKFIQDQTQAKAHVFKNIPSPFGIYASVVLADIIVKSNWGEHPLSQPTYKRKAANNLCLLEATPEWSNEQIKYEGTEFKLFENFESFSIHYSDLIIFSGNFKPLLDTASLEKQTQLMGLYNHSLESYNERLNIIISSFGLREFDRGFTN